MSCHLIDAKKVKHFPGYTFTRIVFIVLGNESKTVWEFEVDYGRNFILGLVTGGHITKSFSAYVMDIERGRRLR